ncbi:PREDICTED: uncharacterized protein LOC106099269 [Papilio polytes]|uniref:uncharacterized protein LOC106099269 n=1 Tax=Papilio polytes TaxID=76194 RepID=UPI000675FD87|nr:PREDICTED: uncharacterized protein LOC106099269 [Papilio polytes]
MLQIISIPDRRCLKKSLLLSLLTSAHILNSVSEGRYTMDAWEKPFVGRSFSMSQASCNQYASESKKAVEFFRSWLQTHEEAQIMVGSVLIVFGLWWLARTLFALVVNLLCPLLFVLLAVICVPQLRVSLLGHNYPVVANLLRSILLKMADSLSTTA